MTVNIWAGRRERTDFGQSRYRDAMARKREERLSVEASSAGDFRPRQAAELSFPAPPGLRE
jgi:hypothetical protein